MRPMPSLRSCAVVLLTTLVTACGRPTTSAPGAGPVPDLEPLALPAPSGSSQSQLTQSDTGVILSWLELSDQTATLRFSERSGGVWSEPRTVTSGEDWFLSWADVPSVQRMRDGTLVAHWYPATDVLIEAYDIRLAYSRDDGDTWSPPFAPHHDGTMTQHGFASLFEMPSGGLGIVWLDGREMERSTSPQGGDMAVYFTSFDGTWTQGPETRINDRVCECCQTAVALTADGVLTAFRDRNPREIRDIYLSRLDGTAWTPARPLHVDNFRIDACPINGPALSADGDRVAAAWFAAPEDDPHAFAAFSDDGGESWTAPIRLDDDASLGQVDIELMADSTALASWMEFTDGGRHLRVRRVAPDGSRSAAVDVPGASRVGGYPHMAVAGDELLFAWTDTAGEELKGAVARLSRTTAP